jgi:hypothetical protein
MASLNSAAALTALANVDVELPVDRLARNLALELLGDVGFVEEAAAVRADARQGSLVNFVDLIGGGRLAVGLGAIVLSRLAPWLAGIEIGLTLG